jgi:ribosome-associated translation inhibitor RaiA
MPATSEPLGASSRSVSRLRQQGKHDATPDNDSTASLASRTSSVGDDNADMRSSMDTAIDKVRERTRKSVDERRGSDESVSANRLSSLLERGARKLKRKEKNNDNDGASTLAVNHSGESGELAFSDGGRSEGSLLDEDGHSSLLTDDGSDNERYVQTFHSLRILPMPHNILAS